MKNQSLYLLLVLCVFVFQFSFAQNTPPQFINYQAVAHDNTGEVLSNQPVDVRVSILDGNLNPLWLEDHTGISTNNYGLINLSIGSIETSTFSSIDWISGPRLIQISIDEGFGWTPIGTAQQLVSVPYAFHAETVTIDNIDDADSDTTNEIQNLILNAPNLSISSGNSVDLSSLQDGTGTDDQNINGSGLSGTDLTIGIENGNSETVNLSSLIDDADADTTNELITSLTLNGTVLYIFEGGDTISVNLNSLTPVISDDQNIQGSGLSGTDLTIGIENGNSETVNLSSLQDGTGTDDQNLTGATLTGTSLQIDIESGNSATVNLATLQDGIGTDDQNITGSVLSGNLLTIGIENGGSEDIDLSSLENTDSQQLTLAGTDLSISNGNNVNLSSIVDDGDWVVGTGTVYNANDNIGIGSSFPNYKLTVNQNAGTTSTDLSSFSFTSQASGANSAIYANTNGSGSGNYFGLYSQVSGSSGGQYAIKAFATSTAPSNYGILTSATGLTSGTNYALYSYANGATTNWSGYFQQGDVYIADKLAVGTNSPSANLDVLGTIRYNDGNQANGYILQSDVSGNASWVDPSTVATSNDGDWTTGTNGAGISTVYNLSDPVGIGTNSPDYPIHIESSSYDRSAYIYNNTNSSSNTFGLYAGAFGTGSGDKRGGSFDAFGGTGTNIGVRATASGGTTNWAGYFLGDVYLGNNVGIGTESPSLPLNIFKSISEEPANSGTSPTGAIRLETGDSPLTLDIGIADDVFSGAWLQAHYSSNLASNADIVINPNGGNVGIGTTSPTSRLHVVQDNTIPLKVEGTTNAGAVIDVDAPIGSASGIRFNLGGTGKGGLLYDQLSGNDHLWFFISGGTSNDGLFIENSTYNVGIGTNSATQKLHVVNSTTSLSGVGFFDNFSDAGGTALRADINQTAVTSGTRYGVYSTAWYGLSNNYGGYFYGYGGSVSYGVFARASGASNTNYAVYSSGNQFSTTTSTWTIASDKKLKNNIKDLDINALEIINKFKTKSYVYKYDEYPHMNLPNSEQWGFVAQEVGEIIPEMIRDVTHPADEDENGKIIHPEVKLKGINYDRLYPLLIKAVQEQQIMISDQQQMIEKLKADIELIKNK